MSNYYLYLIYDGRYHTDEDRAIVMDTAHTLHEAQKVRTDYGEDCVIVRCVAIDKPGGPGELINPKVMPNE